MSKISIPEAHPARLVGVRLEVIERQLPPSWPEPAELIDGFLVDVVSTADVTTEQASILGGRLLHQHGEQAHQLSGTH